MAGRILNNLGSLPVVFEKGNGSTLEDTNGKKYIDFVSGIGVNCLGHNHPKLVHAITEQATKQIHISNYYNSDVGLTFSQALLTITGMDTVFFANSGAEANEAAIKIARKLAYTKDIEAGKQSSTRNTIVTLEKSFHGRTITTLAATGQDKFHPPSFAPYTEGFTTIKANDFSALDSAFNENTCALMFEVIQGEGGVNLIDAQWAQKACEAARNAGAIILIDEVQTGVGRTGTFLASEALGITGDIVTLAKGIAGGVPMGAALARGRAGEIFVAGDHQSTFGGNPLACSAGLVVLSEVANKAFLSKVCEKGDYIRTRISTWKLPLITEIRGRGLMIGIDIQGDASNIQKECLQYAQDHQHGLCISTAGPSILRFLPPLNISMEEIDTGLDILYTVLTSVK